VATEEQGSYSDVVTVLHPLYWILYSQSPPQRGLPVALLKGGPNEAFAQLEEVLSATKKWQKEGLIKKECVMNGKILQKIIMS